jgi:hypothetical protein
MHAGLPSWQITINRDDITFLIAIVNVLGLATASLLGGTEHRVLAAGACEIVIR